MTTSTTMTVRLTTELKAKLDRIAQGTRRSKSFLAVEAIENYVDRELEIIDGIQRGISDMKAGRTVPHNEAMARVRSAIAAAKPAKPA